MRLAIALTMMLILTSAAAAELRVTPRQRDLGEIGGSAPRVQAFELVNAGSEPIELLEVERGCGCLAVEFEKRTLGPGEKGRLAVQLRTTGQPNGQRSWNLTVHYREGSVARSQNLVLAATIRNEVTVQPAQLAFYVDKVLKQEVIVTDTRSPALKIVDVSATSRAVKFTTEPLSGGRTKIVLEVAASDLGPGRHDAVLTIVTDDPQYSPLQVPLTLERSQRPSVLVTPARVQVAPAQSVRSMLVRLRPLGEQKVVVDHVESDAPGLSCTWAAGPDEGATLKIQVDGRRLAAGTHRVRVHLAEPKREVVTIPVILADD